MRVNLFLLSLSLFIVQNLSAMPIDWTGGLSFDTNILANARGTGDDCTAANGSMCPGNDDDNARFQSYVFKLQPNLIVNDSATIKGEISTGTIRGGFLGDGASGTTPGAVSDSYYAQTSGAQSLTINQLFVELYSDTALFKVGTYAKEFGLGAMINAGEGDFDRFFSQYSGLEAEFRLGKIAIRPLWSKVNSPAFSDSARVNNGKYDIVEMAISAEYEDTNNNFRAGVYYGQREVDPNTNLFGNVGNVSSNLIDVYVEKEWKSARVGLEVPMLTGQAGTLYGSSSEIDFDSRAVILEADWYYTPAWTFGLRAGQVNGEDGQSKFEALYLHPNYKIAELMFNYNLAGFQQTSENIFDESITNSTYYAFDAYYKGETWSWQFLVAMATANETADQGSTFYDHNRNSYQTALAKQDSDLGLEFDLAFDYEWAPNIFVHGYVAYWQVGDYYAFLNDASNKLDMDAITATGARVSVRF